MTPRRGPGRWLDSATPFELLLWRQHDVISTNQAGRFLSPEATRQRVNSGKWQRPCRRVLVAHSGPLTDDRRLWVALLSIGGRAYLGGLTAARRQGFKAPYFARSEQIHVVTPAADRHLNVPRPVVVHRTTTLVAADIHASAVPPRTSMVRSIVDAASWARSDRDAHALVAAAYQQRRVASGELDPVLARLIRVKRRQLIISAVRDAELGVHSELEHMVVGGLRAAKLPIPTLQYRRRDSAGQLRFLDGYYEEWQLHLEIDGGQHLDQSSYWRDMKRQNKVWISGDRILRFPAIAVRYDLDEVIADVRQALLAAGWRP